MHFYPKSASAARARASSLMIMATLLMLVVRTLPATLSEGSLATKDYWLYEFPAHTAGLFWHDGLSDLSDMVPEAAEWKDSSNEIHRFIFFQKTPDSSDPWSDPGLYYHQIEPDNTTTTEQIFSMCDIAGDLGVSCTAGSSLRVAQFDAINSSDGALYIAASITTSETDSFNSLRVYKFNGSTFALRTNVRNFHASPSYPPLTCSGSSLNAIKMFAPFQITPNPTLGSGAYTIYLLAETKTGNGAGSCVTGADVIRLDQIGASLNTLTLTPPLSPPFEATGIGQISIGASTEFNLEWSAFYDRVESQPRLVYNQAGIVKSAIKKTNALAYTYSNIYSIPSGETVPIHTSSTTSGTAVSQAIFASDVGSQIYRVYDFGTSTLNTFSIDATGYTSAESVLKRSDFFFLPNGRPLLVAKSSDTVLALTPYSFLNSAPLYGSEKAHISTSLETSTYDLTKLAGIANAPGGGDPLPLQMQHTNLALTKTTAVYNPVTNAAEVCTFLVDSDLQKYYALIQRVAGLTSYVTRSESVASPLLTISGNFPAGCLAYAAMEMPNGSVSLDPEYIYKLTVNVDSPYTEALSCLRIRLQDLTGPPDAYVWARSGQSISLIDFDNIYPDGKTIELYTVGRPTISRNQVLAELFQTGASGTPITPSSVNINSFTFSRVAPLEVSNNVASWDFGDAAQPRWSLPPSNNACYGLLDGCAPCAQSSSGTVSTYSGGVLTLGCDHDGFISASSPTLLNLSKGFYRFAILCRISNSTGESQGGVPMIRARISPEPASGYSGYVSDEVQPIYGITTPTGDEYIWKNFYLTVVTNPAEKGLRMNYVLALDMIDLSPDSGGARSVEWKLEVKKARLDKLDLVP